MEKVNEWQSRPLDRVYPILYLDGLVIKVRQDKRVINKTINAKPRSMNVDIYSEWCNAIDNLFIDAGYNDSGATSQS